MDFVVLLYVYMCLGGMEGSGRVLERGKREKYVRFTNKRMGVES